MAEVSHDDFAGAHAGRRRARLWAVAALGLIVLGGLAAIQLSHSRPASANEYGSALTQVSATSWRITSPSGLSALVSAEDVTPAGVSGQALSFAPRDLSWVPQSPPVPDGTMGLGVGIGGSGGVYAYPVQWSGDQQWHPATAITIQFDHPVVNPSLPLASYSVPALHSVNGVRTGAGAAIMQLRFTGASGPSGSVPIEVSPQAGFRTSLYSVSANTVTPRQVNGRLPYLSAYSIYCDPATPLSTDPSYSPWLDDQFAGVRYIAGPCGSLAIDTGGQAITQLTVAQDLSYAAAATDLPGGLWDGASLHSLVLSYSVPTEVSGSQTPAGLGAATHVASTLAIGTPGDSPAIDPAFSGQNLTTATAGSATDNSDAGYTADANLTHPQLTSQSSGSFTLQVPYTGLSQDAYLNGWIDFDGDGQWDPGEQATSVASITHTSGASQAGTAALTFSIPSGGLQPTQAMWLRLRLAYDAADVASPSGMARSGEVEDHALTVLDATPDLEVHKTAAVVNGGTAVVGSVIEYQVHVTNLADSVAARDITITDQIPAGIDVDLTHAGTTPGLSLAGRVLSAPAFDLEPDGEATITYFGTATAVGTQTNVVVAETPLGCQTSSGPGAACSSSTDTDIQPEGQLQLAKTTPDLADDAVLRLGQQVTYRFTVTNDTPDPVTNISLDDPLLGQAMCQLALPSLAAGQSAWCEARYTVTQQDVDNGRIINTATVSGDGPGGPVPGDDSGKTNDTGADGGQLVISKTATLPGGAVSAQQGDVITYRITAANTSGYTMSAVTVSDPVVAALSCTVAGDPVTFPLATLAPGGVIVCTGTHQVTAADAAAGHVANTATGQASLPPSPDDPGTPIPAGVVPGSDDVPVGGLTTVKQVFDGGTEITSQRLTLGQVVTFRVTVTNTSAYPVTALEISDPMLRDAHVSLTCDPPLPITLAHAEQVTCTAPYTVTQADIDRGHVANTATATGQWPDDPGFPGMPVGPVPPSQDSTDTPTVYPEGGTLTLSKDAEIHDAATGAVKQAALAGDQIVYTITARNTTGLTMSDVTLEDSLLPSLGSAASSCSTDSPAATGVTLPATLPPGAQLTCVAMYTVTPGDAAAGKVANVVTGHGEVPGQWDPGDPGATPAPVPVAPEPAANTQPVGGLVVTKSALAPRSPALAGDRIVYTIRIQNTSAFPLADVTLTDSLVAGGSLTLACLPAGASPLSGMDLAPLAAVTCSGIYVVTAADAAAGRVINTAAASGSWGPVPPGWAGPAFPAGPVPASQDSVTTPAGRGPAPAPSTPAPSTPAPSTPGPAPSSPPGLVPTGPLTPAPSATTPGTGASFASGGGKGSIRNGTLSFTGAEIGWAALIALALLGAGSAAVLAARRRGQRR